MNRLTGTAAAVIAATLSLSLGAAVTAIATPSVSGTTYAGCVAKKSGALYAVTTGAAKCRKKDKAISWNQTGPSGATGPTGAQGPQGPAGSGVTTTGQAVNTAYQSAQLNLAAGSQTDTPIGGLSLPVTVPAGYKAVVSAYGGVRTATSAAGQFARFSVGLKVDGAYLLDGLFSRKTCSVPAASTQGECDFSFSGAAPVSAGSHTFSLVAQTNTGGTTGVIIGGSPGGPTRPS